MINNRPSRPTALADSALVMESFPGTHYADTEMAYQFPGRYLRFFEPLRQGREIIAVVYEPRGPDKAGRVAYVGLVRLVDPPVAADDGLYSVRYVSGIHTFPVPVPREIDLVPVESWLVDIPPGRLRNSATRGRAVRPLEFRDLENIVRLGDPEVLLERSSREDIGDTEAERARRLCARLERSHAFRRDILRAYGDRCAISGFSSPHVPGVVEAAHIRPVALPHGGDDEVQNGIALTATLHRMFDAGAISLEYVGRDLVLRVSRGNGGPVRMSGRSGFNLDLRDGLPVLLPSDDRFWPRPNAVRYHRERIFRR